MAATALRVNEEEEILHETSTYEQRAQAIVVRDQDSMAQAGEIVIELKATEKKIKDYWRDPKAKAAAAHKEICNKENEMLGPVQRLYTALQGKISGYLTEQEQIRRAEQLRLDREREERERKEREKLEKRAAAAEAKGDVGKADALRERAEEVHIPVAMAEPVVDRTVRTGNGAVSQRTEYTVEVTDVKAFCAEIAAGNVPPGVVEFKPAQLKAFVKQWGHTSFPGLTIREAVKGTFRGR